MLYSMLYLHEIQSSRNLEIYSEIWKFISKCEISLQFIQISKFRRRNFLVKDPSHVVVALLSASLRYNDTGIFILRNLESNNLVMTS